MKLLIDSTDFNYKEQIPVKNVISESLGKGKNYYIQGIFAQSEKENRNGRYYSRSVMENAVSSYQKIIDSKRSLGEMKHPSSPQVDLERASHIIESLTWEGNDVIGKARILTTLPMGIIAKGLIDEGVQFGVSTRGLGSLIEKNGVNVVQPDFIISAVDIVGDPSGPDCWVNGIMESQDWVFVDGKFERQVDEARRSIRSAPSNRLEEVKALAFQQFLKSIK
jgi:hypothetical protein